MLSNKAKEMKLQKQSGLRLILLATGMVGLSTTTIAAQVPPGTELAATQELVRNNGSEPASLDPHKVESDVEFNIISDLFDGLVAVKADGTIEQRAAENWEKKEKTIWNVPLRSGNN